MTYDQLITAVIDKLKTHPTLSIDQKRDNLKSKSNRIDTSIGTSQAIAYSDLSSNALTSESIRSTFLALLKENGLLIGSLDEKVQANDLHKAVMLMFVMVKSMTVQNNSFELGESVLEVIQPSVENKLIQFDENAIASFEGIKETIQALINTQQQQKTFALNAYSSSSSSCSSTSCSCSSCSSTSSSCSSCSSCSSTSSCAYG
jgi:hypothetical protein